MMLQEWFENLQATSEKLFKVIGLDYSSNVILIIPCLFSFVYLSQLFLV